MLSSFLVIAGEVIAEGLLHPVSIPGKHTGILHLNEFAGASSLFLYIISPSMSCCVTTGTIDTQKTSILLGECFPVLFFHRN